MSAEEIVREFCASVSKRDEALLRPLLADDVVYHNIGMAPSVGIDATVENLAGQWAMFPTTYEFEMRNVAAARRRGPHRADRPHRIRRRELPGSGHGGLRGPRRQDRRAGATTSTPASSGR